MSQKEKVWMIFSSRSIEIGKFFIRNRNCHGCHYRSNIRHLSISRFNTVEKCPQFLRYLDCPTLKEGRWIFPGRIFSVGSFILMNTPGLDVLISSERINWVETCNSYIAGWLRNCCLISLGKRCHLNTGCSWRANVITFNAFDNLHLHS